MSEIRTELVVSLPARTVEDTRLQADEARIAGADLAEVRLDRWSPRERRHVAQLFPSSLPLIATLRSRAEGGEGPDDPAAREEVLITAAAEPFAFVDLESSRDRRLEGPVGDLGRKVVRSSHLTALASTHEVGERLGEGAPSHGVLKVVLPASFARAVRDLLPLLEAAPDPRPVLLTTGPSGSLWRAWAARLRVPWVYVSLPTDSSTGTVEPSQIPVDRLETFLAAPDAPIFAVVGHPVAHSQSPTIHHGWMRRAGRAGLYVLLDIASSEEFRLAMEALPPRGVLGLNVTHPWKRLAYECAANRSADALATGAANCLTFRDGRVEADNTDLGAVQRRLGELKEKCLWDGRALTVLGGGGAARATLAAAQRIRARATVLTRRPAEAESLASEFEALAGHALDPTPADLVVHATDVGRAGGGPLEFPLRSLLSDRSYVLDWVYSPEIPTISESARGAGATYEDGRRLLVYQAAATYGQWWGETPDAESIEEAVREVTCAV
ncbi:MAG TPA: type I 3-dehydroquinate dehydratase [Thermoplasmata archaeon]|nr:type I 3-dehydroquinate dehydratase [Thermoplasmata archaeon]